MASEVLPKQLAWKQEIWFILIGLLGAGWLWFVTSRHGIGVSPDSVVYLAVARHLLEGKGFLSYQGELFITQPPLYPIVIAILRLLFGLDLITSTLVLNLLLFICITYISGKLVFLVTNSFLVSLFTCFSVVLGIPIIHISVYAWSELLFIFFINTALLFIVRFIIHENEVELTKCSFFIGCSCATRYVGIFVLIPFLIFAVISLRRKSSEIAKLLLISSSPIFFWVLRNYILSGSFFGRSYTPLHSIVEHGIALSYTISKWFIFPINSYENKALLFLALSLLLFLLFIVAIDQTKNLNLLPIRIFVFTYLLLLFIACITTQQNIIDDRLLSPVFIPITIIVINFLYHRVYLLFRDKVTKKTERLITAVGIAIWFIHPAISTLKLGLNVFQEGLGYHAIQWRNSKTVSHIYQSRNQLIQLPIYTNQPEGVYFFTNIQAGRLVCTQNYLRFYATHTTLLEAEQKYLICFKEDYHSDCFGILEKLQHSDIRLVAKFSDGAIYLMKHEKPQASDNQ